ncbi:alpha/beta hydrolase [Limibacillus sp. MBR-115]|jgi:arylformamidase|uniref:alpha/beta hydrolase n=1 Tax=Limibacillus sp. MBR-115 TaxID=3156465 RepID=UPI00339A85C5
MSAIVHRSYTREQLDAQLNNRLLVPDHPEYFRRWSEDSQAAVKTYACRQNLAYGSSQGERLDLFPISHGAAERAPLLAFIHGGWWQSLDKSDFNYLAPPYLEAGVAFASINYDLAPKATIPQITDQVRRAIAWLHDNAQRYGIDERQIYVAGHSAGGHLAAMCFGTDWSAYGVEQNPIAGGVSVSGVYDLSPLIHSYQQPVLRLTEQAIQSYSPLALRPLSQQPLICAVGAEESQEFLDQQEDFLAAWIPQGANLKTIDLPGCNHFSAVDCLGKPGHPLLRATLDLIKAA